MCSGEELILVRHRSRDYVMCITMQMQLCFSTSLILCRNECVNKQTFKQLQHSLHVYQTKELNFIINKIDYFILEQIRKEINFTKLKNLHNISMCK